MISDATVAARASWLPEVEAATEPWRQWRAGDLLRRGERTALVDVEATANEGNAEFRDALLEGYRDGQCVSGVQWRDDGLGIASRTLPINGWHYQRAMAQLDRFARIGECDSKVRRVRCDCGDFPEQSTLLHCDHWQLCVECQGRRCARYRARFERGREAMLLAYHRELCNVRHRWSEKFVTLTVPHSGHAGSDVFELRRAFPELRASLGRYLLRKGSTFGALRGDAAKKLRSVPFWRSLEVTESDDGHAHYHLWLLAPFIPKALLRHWWGRALSEDYRRKLPRVLLSDVLATADKRDHAELRRAAIVEEPFRTMVFRARRRASRVRWLHGADSFEGREATAECHALVDAASFLYNGVTDIRACDERTAYELVKYIVKNAEWQGDTLQPMDAAQFASIYAGVGGARVLATSPHWIAEQPPPVQWCECCGASLEVSFERAPTLRAQSPPDGHAHASTP